MSEFKFGDVCLVKEPVLNYRKKNGAAAVIVPARAPVKIISVSANMAIIEYDRKSFSTRIDNLEVSQKNGNELSD